MYFSGALLTLWQLVITSEMVGLEANVALEVILMIANLQTLGVPIRYASIPGTVSAAFGILLIPLLGFVLDRWAKSRLSKAKILAFTTLIQLAGSLCVLLANGIKLATSNGEVDNSSNGSSSMNISDLLSPGDVKLNGPTNTNLTSSFYSGINTTAEAYSHYTFQSFHNNSDLSEPWLTQTTQSYSSQRRIPSALWPHSDINHSFPNPQNSYNWNLTARQGFPVELSALQGNSIVEEAIPFYAYIAMVGYCMLDCGYDSSNCFLKTFVLHCTPTEHHVSIIVKSIMVSSVGGVLVSILGSVHLGEALTAGTGYDSNAALACFTAALGSLLLFLGAFSTFTTGFCWKCPSYRYVDTTHEKARLVTSSTHELNSPRRQDHMTTSERSKSRLEQSISRYLTSTSLASDGNQIVDAVKLEEPHRPGIVGFIHRQRKQILVNMSAFFMLSSLYSFEVFVVNFLGMGVFEGDPAASSDSQEYSRYLDGVAVGSQGTLIYYILFAITSVFHEKSLSYFGWKLETVFTGMVYTVLSLAAAITKELWLFYALAVWTGVFRAVSVSVPYILANQISAELNGGKSSGAAIATVAAMLPCGFVVCSAIMGPLIDATGNPAASVYYSAVCSFVGCILITMLKT